MVAAAGETLFSLLTLSIFTLTTGTYNTLSSGSQAEPCLGYRRQSSAVKRVEPL